MTWNEENGAASIPTAHPEYLFLLCETLVS